MPGQGRATAKAPGDRDSGTYNHKPKGRQKAARNSNIALHSITHTYRMERLPGIEPRYKRNGLPYSYHIYKDTKETDYHTVTIYIRIQKKKLLLVLKLPYGNNRKPRRLLATGAGVFRLSQGIMPAYRSLPAARLPSPDILPPREALSPHHHGTPPPTEVRPCIWEPRVHGHEARRPQRWHN